MLHRCFDANLINLAANHPDVRPFLGSDSLGDLDFEEAVGDRNNIFLMGEHGGFVMAWSAPGVYEIHVMILPEGRGKWAAQVRKITIDYARSIDAKMLWARIAPSAKYVALFARRGGMQPTGEMLYTLGHAYDVYKMEL